MENTTLPLYQKHNSFLKMLWYFQRASSLIEAKPSLSKDLGLLIISTPLAPPDFQTFLQPWKAMELKTIIIIAVCERPKLLEFGNKIKLLCCPHRLYFTVWIIEFEAVSTDFFNSLNGKISLNFFINYHASILKEVLLNLYLMMSWMFYD